MYEETKNLDYILFLGLWKLAVAKGLTGKF